MSLQDSIYLNSPVFIQNFGASYYGFKLFIKKYLLGYNDYLNYLNKSQWMSKFKFNNLQLKLLKNCVREAYYNVPFYNKTFKEANVKPDDIKKLSDLSKLPILTKEEVRYNSHKLCSKKYKNSQVEIHHTSGTTGKALELIWGNDALMREYSFVSRHRNSVNVYNRDVHATFNGRLIKKYSDVKPPFWRHNFFENQYLFSMHHLSEINMNLYIKQLKKIKPIYIEGYPSLIYSISEFINNNNFKPINVKAIFTSSETLLDYQRKSIEKAFNTKVLNWYGNTELAGSASECEFGSMHINGEYGIFEVLKDGDSVINEKGELILTNFINPAMPFIRYNIGDIASVSNEYCKCGRVLPILNEVEGRMDDIIITPEGVFLGRLDHIFKSLENIKESQIIQEKLDKIIVKIVPRKNYSKKDEISLMYELQTRMGPSFYFEIKCVEKIEKDKSGKFRSVISKINKQ